jgi:acetyl-CoA carboxylase carboxyltransferase component
MRKAYTAGFYAMGGAGFDPDRILALPTADITIYGEKALDMLADDQQVSAEIRENVKTYSHDTVRIGNYRESGYLDAIITQDEIRVNVEAFLRRAYGKPASSDRPRRILCI